MNRTLHTALPALLLAGLWLPAGCKSDPPPRPPRGEELRPSMARPTPASPAMAARRPPAPGRRTAPDSKTIQAILSEASALVAHGRAMEKLQTRDVVRCVRMMRKHRPAARELQSRLRTLPSQLQVPLASAVGSVDLCVTCSPSAARYCLSAERAIATARESLGLPTPSN